MKTWYDVETRDHEGPVGRYVATLTDIQAGEVKALLDRAVAEGLFPSYGFQRFPMRQAHVLALTAAAVKAAIRDDMSIVRGRGPEMGASKRRLNERELEREMQHFLSHHHYRKNPGEEVYEFDMRLPGIHIPERVKAVKGFSEADLAKFVEKEIQDKMRLFGTVILEPRFPWISDWFQDGRFGGWLVLVTDDPVMDEHGRIPGPDAPWNLGDIRKRLDDLKDIGDLSRDWVGQLVWNFESPAWWRITPKDWKPRKK